MPRTARAACALALVAALGCAGGTVRARTQATAATIAAARQAGALRCAPVELARAEAHNDFARHALALGNYHAARRDAAEAARAAGRALLGCQVAAVRRPDPEPGGRGDPPARGAAGGDADADADADRVGDADDRCPRVPEDRDGFADGDGCPEDDNDRDGLVDKIDRCPDDPEDRDGVDDDDGCPDADNDRDGLADKIDKCPAEAEDRDGFEDDDGCADPDNDRDGVADLRDGCPGEAGPAPGGCPQQYDLIAITAKRIELKQPVVFGRGGAAIQRVSHRLLNEVARALRDRPTLALEIQGHTDSQGAAATNRRLSQRRAEAVRAYLVRRGVARSRLTARGYGEREPIADNRTAAGRAQNRRVDLVITAR
jgi:outer membrane protein OmpA-like peptidoglycan-associated protein